MAGRAGLKVTLDDFDAWSRQVPVVANIRPSGKYLMEDFHRAGGLRALWSGLQELLDTSAKLVDGRTLADSIAQAQVIDPDVIRTPSNPIVEQGGTCVLRGNLAPNGCVIKASASTARLLQHRGPAVVFENYPDLKKRIHDPDLPVTAGSAMPLVSSRMVEDSRTQTVSKIDALLLGTSPCSTCRECPVGPPTS